MPLSPSTQREVDNVQEADERIRARNAQDKLRVTDVHIDDIIDLNCPQARRIFKWMSKLPPNPTEFLNPKSAPEKTAEIYKDYLNWAASAAEHLKKELDKHEMEYRRLGLK